MDTYLSLLFSSPEPVHPILSIVVASTLHHAQAVLQDLMTLVRPATAVLLSGFPSKIPNIDRVLVPDDLMRVVYEFLIEKVLWRGMQEFRHVSALDDPKLAEARDSRTRHWFDLLRTLFLHIKPRLALLGNKKDALLPSRTRIRWELLCVAYLYALAYNIAPFAAVMHLHASLEANKINPSNPNTYKVRRVPLVNSNHCCFTRFILLP